MRHYVTTVDYHAIDAAKQFLLSLKNTGFAVLTNHPLNPQLIADTYRAWQSFFESEQKFDYLPKAAFKQDGYFPFKTENAKNRHISDLKEFYHFYPDGQRPHGTAELSLTVYQQLTDLATTLLRWIEAELPAQVTQSLKLPLCQMIENSPNTLLRILHYPPLTSADDPAAERASAHEDINLITLLPAATTPGLEVLDRDGQWHAVACDPGSIVVNVGDMLSAATQNYLVSTTHRVVNPDQTANISRYSMPFFLHARPDVMLTAQLNAGEYLAERLRQIGIY